MSLKTPNNHEIHPRFSQFFDESGSWLRKACSEAKQTGNPAPKICKQTTRKALYERQEQITGAGGIRTRSRSCYLLVHL